MFVSRKACGAATGKSACLASGWFVVPSGDISVMPQAWISSTP